LEDSLVCGRVERAKNLLLNPHYEITEIASELGFESLRQFNRAFRRWAGESPQSYRARLPVALRTFTLGNQESRGRASGKRE
jgi:AraC-like DNA-binding protein